MRAPRIPARDPDLSDICRCTDGVIMSEIPGHSLADDSVRAYPSIQITYRSHARPDLDRWSRSCQAAETRALKLDGRCLAMRVFPEASRSVAEAKPPVTYAWPHEHPKHSPPRIKLELVAQQEVFSLYGVDDVERPAS